MAEILNKDNFEEKVLNKENVVLVDFFATWCGPCKMLSPVIDELAEEAEDGLDIYKVDIDESRDLAMEYGVRSVPTMIIFKNGEIKDTMIGALPKENIKENLDSYK